MALTLNVVSVALALCAVALLASAHPSMVPQKPPKTACQSEVPPIIFSYHIHVLFLGNNKNNTAEAMRLRSDFMKTFANLLNSSLCPTLYYNNGPLMCMFEPSFKPWGPFPTAEWAVFIQPQYFSQVVPWFMQRRQLKGRINSAGGPGVHRPAFSFILHPNTGCEYEDHGKWQMWGGDPWPLDMGAMDTEHPFYLDPPDWFGKK